MAGGRSRGPWYVSYKGHGGTAMHVFETKHLALKAAAVILSDPTAEVQVGPMLDTREGVLKGAELRLVTAELSTKVQRANTTTAPIAVTDPE